MSFGCRVSCPVAGASYKEPRAAVALRALLSSSTRNSIDSPKAYSSKAQTPQAHSSQVQRSTRSSTMRSRTLTTAAFTLLHATAQVSSALPHDGPFDSGNDHHLGGGSFDTNAIAVDSTHDGDSSLGEVAVIDRYDGSLVERAIPEFPADLETSLKWLLFIGGTAYCGFQLITRAPGWYMRFQSEVRSLFHTDP